MNKFIECKSWSILKNKSKCICFVADVREKMWASYKIQKISFCKQIIKIQIFKEVLCTIVLDFDYVLYVKIKHVSVILEIVNNFVFLNQVCVRLQIDSRVVSFNIQQLPNGFSLSKVKYK